jgi:hypothetical protein
MLNLRKYINIPVFIISLAIGLFFVYVTMPDMRKIYVYPTHENHDKIQYKDKTDSCFSIVETEVECPTDESQIEKIPVQA